MNPALLLVVSLASSPVAIENVRVEVGDGTVIEKTTVVFWGGKIRSVGAAKLPPATERIDGTGKVLAPGFIETSSKLGAFEVGLESATSDSGDDEELMVPALRVADGFNPLSSRITIEREEGVTSAIVAPSGTLIYGTGSWFDLTGSIESAPDPAIPIAMYAGVSGRTADHVGGSRGSLWLLMRQVFEDARFYGRNTSAIDRGDHRPLLLDPIHLRALQPVIDGKIPFVVNTHRQSDIRASLAFARKEKLDLVILGGSEAWMMAKELADADIPVILRPSQQRPGSFDALGARMDAAAVLQKAGVDVVLTTSDWDANVRRLRQEAGIAVSYGLPHAQAIRAITLTPAEIFGKARELGSVSAGKRANLVLWSGDPLELSSIAERIWIDGSEMPLDNRQRRLAERYLGQPYAQ